MVRLKVSADRWLCQGFQNMANSNKNNEDEVNNEAKEKYELITWDHPVVSQGLVPGHLIHELMGYTDGYWKEWLPLHKSLYINSKNGPLFSLPAILDYISNPHRADDEKEKNDATNKGKGGRNKT